ncbi:MAG: enoyl-CoA hydratase [Haloarculaceae archaeon]|jgi:enoyl-CoA hydratase
MSDAVTTTVEDGVCTIRLDRPVKYNAMTLEMWRAVTDAVRDVPDDGAHAIVLTGTGEVFCAGDDIQALADIADEQDVRRLVETLSACFDAIETAPVPVVGRANGSAYGGGFELLLAADVTVVPEGATFALPETQIGVIPLYGAKRLSQLVGRQRAADLALAGRELSASEAVEWGLFARSVPADDLDEAVTAVLEGLEQSSREALATTKAWLNAPFQLDGEDVGMRTGLGHLYAGPDAREGVEAFLDDREPDFSG